MMDKKPISHCYADEMYFFSNFFFLKLESFGILCFLKFIFKQIYSNIEQQKSHQKQFKV